jgi:hypothetical protein
MSALGPDESTIRATWRWLAHGAHGVSEVRVIRPAGGIIGIGFFDDEEAFVRECVRTNAAGNVYVGIQPRPRRLFDAAPNVVRPLKTGAGRKDIEVITATVIDLDPVRPKDTASTDAELALAMAAANEAIAWCESEGLVRPRLMMSGNGAQLWFALPPTALEGERRERLQAGLKAFETKVRERAQTDAVHVDSIHDVARIIKVIGTVSHKGDGQGRPPAPRERRALRLRPRRGREAPRASRRRARAHAARGGPARVAAGRRQRARAGHHRRRSARPRASTTGSTRSRCAVPSSASGTTAPRTAASPSSTWCASSRTRGSGLDELTELILEWDRPARGWASCAVATAFATSRRPTRRCSPPRAPTAPSRRRATRSRRSASAR